MSQDDNYTWQGNVFHQAEPQPNAAQVRSDQLDGPAVVTIGNVDLPAFISSGELYIQAPLPLLFEAFAEDFSAFISDMEIGVSTTWGTTLSLDSDGRPVPGPTVVVARMVRGRRQR